MKTRILAAAVGAPALFAVLFFLPAVYSAVLLALMGIFIAAEFLRAAGNNNIRLTFYACAAAAAVPVCRYFSLGYAVFTAIVLVLFALVTSESIIAFEKGRPLGAVKMLAVIFAGAVIPLMLSSLLTLKIRENGRLYILLPIITAFLSDAGAYFAGKFLGKHKAFPKTSPHKTVEGCIGGAVVCIISLLIYGLILDLTTELSVNYFYLAFYGVAGSAATQLGDLLFSLFKREFSVKDYGDLIPGHGGMLDRFDSMTMAAPTVCILALLIPAF